MKKLLKGAAFGLSAAAMLMSLASCSKKSNKALVEDDRSEHVVVTYMTTGNKPTNGATEKMLERLNKILTEKVNAELQIYYIPWTNYLTTYNLTLIESIQNGTVDLVGTASDWLDAWKNAKNGAFLPMSEEMLKANCPQTWATVSSDHWNMCKYDGEIYLIPEDNYAQWINHGFMYRGDWAREAGLDGVHSWEDLTTYFKYVKDNKPGVIPWDSDAAQSTYHGEGYIQSKSDYVALDGISSQQMFGVRRSNLKKIYSPFLEGDELVEYAKLMKKWDEIGVWKKDVLNNSSDNRSEFYLGQVAADQHHTQTWYTQVRPEMDEKQPGSDVGFFWFGEESGNVTTMTITHGAMALSAGSKHPARALAVYDLIRNDRECYELFNYGIEGEQYVLTANGLRTTPENYSADDNSIVTDYWWGRNDNLELRDAKGAWDKFNEISAIYDSTKIDYPYGQIVWDLDQINAQLSNISDVWANYMGRICYGKNNDPVAYVAEFRQALKQAGIDAVLENLQSQLDAFNKK